jgi:hypothetical protein
MMLLSDSVGGAEDSRNGFLNFRPVNVTEMFGVMRVLLIGRTAIIGKTEGMATVAADVFRMAAAAGQVMDDVAETHANHRVSNRRRAIRGSASRGGGQKRMPAEARIFLQPIPRRHELRAVAEEAAQVPNLFLEGGGRAIGIVSGVKEQRVPALPAHVLVAPVAIGELLVMMLAEKARQRVPHARDGQILPQIVRPAPAPPVSGSGYFEGVIVHVVPP